MSLPRFRGVGEETDFYATKTVGAGAMPEEQLE